jgi:hypothetical protein
VPSHHTSNGSLFSGNSLPLCYPKGRWIIRWVATALAYPIEWSSRSSCKFWCSATTLRKVGATSGSRSGDGRVAGVSSPQAN